MFSQRGSAALILIVVILVLTLVAGVFLYQQMTSSPSTPTQTAQNPTVQNTSVAQSNPFDPKTQYSNPFDYQNPFDDLK